MLISGRAGSEPPFHSWLHSGSAPPRRDHSDSDGTGGKAPPAVPAVPQVTLGRVNVQGWPKGPGWWLALPGSVLPGVYSVRAGELLSPECKSCSPPVTPATVAPCYCNHMGCVPPTHLGAATLTLPSLEPACIICTACSRPVPGVRNSVPPGEATPQGPSPPHSLSWPAEPWTLPDTHLRVYCPLPH